MSDSAEDSPNVLCISIDSLRADYCSFLNEEETTTPFIESLDDAAVYTNAITPSCWTLQVHTSIFTGLYPPEHQVDDKDRTLGSCSTFAEILSEKGYDSHSFGYNGWLEAADILRGYEHHATRELADNTFEAIVKKLKHALFVQQIRDEITVNNFLEQLDRSDEPFCHFVHLDDAHYIYTPPRPYHRMYTDTDRLSLTLNLLHQRKLYDSRAELYVDEYEPDPRHVEIMKNLYRGCIRMEDDFVKRIFDGLRERGVLEDTVVVIFGDHGDNFGEDGIYGHQLSVADSLIRVPLVVYDPTGTLPEGKHSRLVQLNDLFPTILELCGEEPPETHSLSLLEDEERDAAFTYYSVADSFIDRISDRIDVNELPPKRQYAVWKSPDEKAVYYPDTETWKEDEPDDESLREELLAHLSTLSPIDTRGGADVSDDVKKNLEEMGYL